MSLYAHKQIARYRLEIAAAHLTDPVNPRSERTLRKFGDAQPYNRWREHFEQILTPHNEDEFRGKAELRRAVA